jgi:uncharacterized protein (TIGR02246 family)
MLSRLLLTASLALAALAPAPSALAQSQSDATDPIKAVHEQWANDWRSKDTVSLRALYAEDTELLPAENRMVSGPNDIGEYFRKLIDASPHNNSFFFVTDTVEVSGDLAYESGFIQYWPADRTAPVKGNYILILKRNAAGKWLILKQAMTQISPYADFQRH